MDAQRLKRLKAALGMLVTRRLSLLSDGVPYEFERLPLKKVLNALLVEAAIWFKPARSWGLPVNFQVEPSACCNLRCALCPVATGLERPQGHMDFATFKRLVDEIGEYVFIGLLWDWGEPFLNPSIYDMIAYARQHGIRVVSSTNGHVFATADHAERLVRSGLDSIIFAVDGVSQETYQKYRQGGRLETALQGIRAVIEKKRALGSRTPLVNLRFIVMKHNEHEIPALRELAAQLQVDVLSLKTLNPHSQYHDATPGEDHDNGFLPTEPRYRRFRTQPDGRTRVRRRRNPCRQLWNTVAVHWDGKICACTFDPHENFVLGDLKRDSLRAIWRGELYQQMRRRFHRQWEVAEPCASCTYAYEGGSCRDEIIRDVLRLNSTGAKT